MPNGLKRTEINEIEGKVRNAFNNLSKTKRDEAFDDLLDVTVFFRALSHDAVDDLPREPVGDKVAK